MMMNIDGIYDPDSLTPTPETTPEKDIPTANIRCGLDDYLESSNDEEVSILNKSFTASPEWDSYGTDLERPLLYDQHLGHVTHLDRPVNLSLVLPLTSTPHPRPRVSRQRRLLPLEVAERLQEPVREDEDEAEHTPGFMSRLNPFKKKKKVGERPSQH